MRQDDTDIERDAAAGDPPAAGRRMPHHVHEVLTWLAHVVDETLPLRTGEDERDFAERHLGAGGSVIAAVREDLGPFTAALVARVIGVDMRQHPPYEVAGRESDEAPTWTRLELDGATERVPAALVAAFDAGTLAPVRIVVVIETRTDWRDRRLEVYVRAGDEDAAEAYLHDVMARARGRENYLRGRCLQVTVDGGLQVRPVTPPVAARSDVVVPETVWAEVDVNTAALFRRRDLLIELGLGTNRGLLLYGRPGTGKSALCRVLASELCGEVTVVFCSARAIAHRLEEVYQEVARLAPALVILEDIDLVIAKRRHGDDLTLHGFLTALDGAMSSYQDVVTLATTNDVTMLDDAAIRAARFDRLIEVPLPDAGLRAAILRRYLGPLAGRVAVADVADATDGASGADLRELVRRAVLVEGDQLDTSTLLALVRTGVWTPRDVGMYV
jgi:hypothetical protein